MAVCWVSLFVKLSILVIISCANLEPRIQSAELLGPEHKYLVQLRVLFYPFETTYEFIFCSGSILNERWIITAKHCMYKDGYQLAMATVIRHMHDDMPKPIDFVDIQIPDVTGRRVIDDVALIMLARPITLNDGIHQAILVEQSYPGQGLKAVVAGYDPTNSSTPRQRTVTLTYCDEGPLCSLSRSVMPRPDQIYSGGPVVLNGKLVGLISEGKNLTICPQVFEEHYVSIAFHYYWIKSVINS